MCGILGVITNKPVTPILIGGLKRLEYRGYDSAGIAVLDKENVLQRARTLGKVAALEGLIDPKVVNGAIGIAHTRWATHGEPSERNAHPHISSDQVAIVHNGIIENYTDVQQKLTELGYECQSDTDSELIAHLVHAERQSGLTLLAAVRSATKALHGAYALAVLDREMPDQIVAVRSGSPLVIGLSEDGHYLASDVIALLPYCHRYIDLQEGDAAVLELGTVSIMDREGRPVARDVHTIQTTQDVIDKGTFRHFMLKEIYEQPEAILATLAGRVESLANLDNLLVNLPEATLEKVSHIHIIACGTSYHAALVAKYWFETIAGVPAFVEVASEYRYRRVVTPQDTLFMTISQSGETADTLAALYKAVKLPYLDRVILCNVENSSMVRLAKHCILTRAGIEIGVASTKAFTTQLCALLLLTLRLAKAKNGSPTELETLLADVQKLPSLVQQAIELNDDIRHLAERFVNKQHALFLGRGIHYPIACEGALKLKEISYIHAEGYPAGELKHGPLALVDEDMPVIAVAPNDELLEKLKNNLHEVRARGAELIVFADCTLPLETKDGITVIPVPKTPNSIAPIVYTIPLQLLAYHVAVLKGTDVDQPRNLAKSVTVE